MRNCLFLILLFPILSVQAQEVPVKFPINEAGRIEFTDVVEVDSIPAKELYSRARLFVANGFVSATDVTKLEDVESFTIVTKGYMPRMYTYGMNKNIGGHVAFKFTIQCKDGKYKYSITELIHVDPFISPQFPSISYSGGALENDSPQCRMCMYPKTWRYIKSTTWKNVHGFISEMLKTMKGDAAFSDKKDW